MISNILFMAYCFSNLSVWFISGLHTFKFSVFRCHIIFLICLSTFLSFSEAYFYFSVLNAFKFPIIFLFPISYLYLLVCKLKKKRNSISPSINLQSFNNRLAIYRVSQISNSFFFSIHNFFIIFDFKEESS